MAGPSSLGSNRVSEKISPARHVAKPRQFSRTSNAKEIREISSTFFTAPGRVDRLNRRVKDPRFAPLPSGARLRRGAVDPRASFVSAALFWAATLGFVLQGPLGALATLSACSVVAGWGLHRSSRAWGEEELKTGLEKFGLNVENFTQSGRAWFHCKPVRHFREGGLRLEVTGRVGGDITQDMNIDGHVFPKGSRIQLVWNRTKDDENVYMLTVTLPKGQTIFIEEFECSEVTIRAFRNLQEFTTPSIGVDSIVLASNRNFGDVVFVRGMKVIFYNQNYIRVSWERPFAAGDLSLESEHHGKSKKVFFQLPSFTRDHGKFSSGIVSSGSRIGNVNIPERTYVWVDRDDDGNIIEWNLNLRDQTITTADGYKVRVPAGSGPVKLDPQGRLLRGELAEPTMINGTLQPAGVVVKRLNTDREFYFEE